MYRPFIYMNIRPNCSTGCARRPGTRDDLRGAWRAHCCWSFRTTIEETLGWTAAVPRYLEQVRLDEEKRCSVSSPCSLTP